MLVQSSRFSFFLEIHPLLPFLRAIELPLVVIMYNCVQTYANNYVQLMTMLCFFSLTVRNYVIQGQGVATDVTVTADVTSQCR